MKTHVFSVQVSESEVVETIRKLDAVGLKYTMRRLNGVAEAPRTPENHSSPERAEPFRFGAKKKLRDGKTVAAHIFEMMKRKPDGVHLSRNVRHYVASVGYKPQSASSALYLLKHADLVDTVAEGEYILTVKGRSVDRLDNVAHPLYPERTLTHS